MAEETDGDRRPFLYRGDCPGRPVGGDDLWAVCGVDGEGMMGGFREQTNKPAIRCETRVPVDSAGLPAACQRLQSGAAGDHRGNPLPVSDSQGSENGQVHKGIPAHVRRGFPISGRESVPTGSVGGVAGDKADESCGMGEGTGGVGYCKSGE